MFWGRGHEPGGVPLSQQNESVRGDPAQRRDGTCPGEGHSIARQDTSHMGEQLCKSREIPPTHLEPSTP